MNICKDCGQRLRLTLYQSRFHWYIGTKCSCGRHDRVSDNMNLHDIKELMADMKNDGLPVDDGAK